MAVSPGVSEARGGGEVLQLGSTDQAARALAGYGGGVVNGVDAVEVAAQEDGAAAVGGQVAGKGGKEGEAWVSSPPHPCMPTDCRKGCARTCHPVNIKKKKKKKRRGCCSQGVYAVMTEYRWPWSEKSIRSRRPSSVLGATSATLVQPQDSRMSLGGEGGKGVDESDGKVNL